MNTLNIKLRSSSTFRPMVEIDGKRMKLSRAEHREEVCSYVTDRDEVEIKIYSAPNELLVKNWFGWYILYYLLSFFGLFDWSYSKNCYTFCYTAKVRLEGETNIDLGYYTPKDGEKVLKIKDDVLEDNETNKYIYDARIKRRYKTALAFKILSWIVIIAIIMLIIIK